MNLNLVIGDKGGTAVLNLNDKDNKPVKAFSVPAWNCETPDAVKLQPSDDGMSCQVLDNGVAGDFVVHATCEGSSTPGGDPIDETLEVVVTAPEDDASETNSNITATNNPLTTARRK